MNPKTLADETPFGSPITGAPNTCGSENNIETSIYTVSQKTGPL